MNRIDAIFKELRSLDRRALMPFICAGAPAPDATAPLLLALQSAGASIVEIGIPYSDPIADGPVIAAAMHDALQAGVTPELVFEQVRSVRDELEIGLVAMVSVSLVYGMGGPEAFVTRAKDAGFDGFIFPDAPLEESAPLLDAARAAGLVASLLIAPTTPTERAREIAAASSGFVYLLARAGVTGERDDAPDIAGRVKTLRGETTLPIACGFGISTAEQVRAVTEHADAAIVGTALVRRLADARNAGQNPVGACEEFVTELSTGLIDLAL